ncbi:MAG: hypothetical protein ABIL09_20870, partial [Gemmatimonadota bacterium]
MAPRGPRLMVLAAVALVAGAGAAAGSPNRVAALGGEARFLVDPVNVFDFPALAVPLAHADLELFAEWGGAVVPMSRSAVGLFANRPTPDLRRYNAYLDTAGSPALAALEVRPWLDAVAGFRLGGEVLLGLAGAYAFDLEDAGMTEASASQARLAAGLRLGGPRRRLDVAAHLCRHRLRDAGAATARHQADGDLYGLELRGRWAATDLVLIVPTLYVQAGGLAIEPARRDVRRGGLGLAANLRPRSGVLALAGLLLTYDGIEEARPAQATTDQWSASLPTLVLGGEAQVGSMVFRVGARHETRWSRAEAAGRAG